MVSMVRIFPISFFSISLSPGRKGKQGKCGKCGKYGKYLPDMIFFYFSEPGSKRSGG